METLKYPGIQTEPQYRAYCQQEALVAEPNPSAATQEAIDLLTRLIETWDRAQRGPKPTPLSCCVPSEPAVSCWPKTWPTY